MHFFTLRTFVLFFSIGICFQGKSQVLDNFNAFAEEIMKEWHVPGMAIGIVKDGQLIQSKGYGYRTLEKRLPVTTNTQFGIASCTKAFTGFTVGKLMDRGLIDIDKPINEYVPGFKLSDEYATNHVTMKDLLCHRSGLGEHFAVWYGSGKTREEIIEAIQHLNLTKEIRYEFQYQYLTYVVAGHVLEKITGKTWEKYTQETIFSPLGMLNSNFSIRDMKRSTNYADPYLFKDGKWEKLPLRNIDAIGPSASINSTVLDLSKWMVMQLSNGKYKNEALISEETIKKTWTPYVTIPDSRPFKEYAYDSYGLGWAINDYRGSLTLSHRGISDGYTSEIAFMPEQGIGVIILTNTHQSVVPEIIKNHIFDELLNLEYINWSKRYHDLEDDKKVGAKKGQDETKKGVPHTHDIGEYAGDFKHPAYGNFKVVLSENKALICYFNTHKVGLEHNHYDIFNGFFEDPLLSDVKFKVSFLSDLNGVVDRAVVHMHGKKNIEFSRIQ